MDQEFKVLLPKLGESILNASVVQWFKKEGDFVKKDEPLLEVSTDKVNSEIPSPVSGIVKEIRVSVDQELNVGDLLAIVSANERNESISPIETKREQMKESHDEGMRDFFSPALLRLAKEKGISLGELEAMSGSGAGGRVTKGDLEKYLEKKSAKPCPISSTRVVLSQSMNDVERVKMTGMRKAIAENMVRSFYEAPHATVVIEADVTELMGIIKRYKEEFLEKHQAKLTITSFVVKAIRSAIHAYPLINSSLEGDTIVVKRFVNVGIAVSVDQGIMVPVIKNCQKMQLPQIAMAIQTLAAKARAGQLNPDDVKEGTITLTNFGMAGALIGIPIIRYPEVAIIGMGSLHKKVMVFENDTFGIGTALNLSLTFDHRVLDGMYGCEFLAFLKKNLEQDLRLE